MRCKGSGLNGVPVHTGGYLYGTYCAQCRCVYYRHKSSGYVLPEHEQTYPREEKRAERGSGA